MELKVWVDGIQRVVCGVTDTSTCQDVVYALAHATGQTGRFTLVEKWRNSERLLAPHEHPLKVLTKWGEYANDVHFVMRRSQNEANKALNQSNNNKNSSSSSNGGNNNQYVQNNKRQHDFLHIFPSNGPNQKPSTNSKEIKKSLTFSCGHATSGSISSENSAPIVSNNNPQPKVDPPLPAANNSVIKSRDGKSRQDLPKGVVKGIPQKQRENSNNSAGRTDRPKHPPPYDEAVSRSSGRFAPSHLSLASPTPTVFPDEDSPSTKRRLITTTSKNETVSSEQSNMLDTTTTTTQPYNRQLNNKSYHQNSRDSPTKSPECIISRGVLPTTTTTTSNHREKSPVKSIEKIPTSPQSNLIEDNPSSKSKQALVGRFENDKQISHTKLPSKGLSDKVTDDSGHDPQYQDLLCLVSLQREKLKNQQTELKQYDDEIVYWESRLHEQEEKLRVLQEELSHLERTQRDQDGELVELDRRPFNEEVELGKQEERTLRSELTLARSQLANCETELLQCHQRIRLLLEEITEERRLQSLREEREKKELEEQEQLLQEQLEALQQQLKEKTDESENQKSATDQVKEELQELESMFSLKQKEMETLMEEIRDANLYSLSLIPTDEGKFVTEGNFNNRPGSTRKIIGSPRQLENAVPTNKNPHGVWV